MAEEVRTSILVEAWVHTGDDRPEAMQALVSQWAPRDGFGAFDAFDAGGTAGLDSTGYFGAVFDGRYVYFVPEMHADLTTHGTVLRYDTHAPFDDPSSYAAYDASRTAGLRTEGYYGGAFDGRYVWFVPRQVGVDHYHSRVLRLDTTADFDDSTSWDAYDLGRANSQQGCAFDGRFLYFCGGYEGDPQQEDPTSGRVIRCDTARPFKDAASYTDVDLTVWFGPSAAGFDGGAFDGRYVYFVPLDATLVARYDTARPFDEQTSWQVYDAGRHGLGVGVGAVFDGRYLYYVPYAHGNVVRFDTRGDFTDPGRWSSHRTDGGGFDGGFFDGRYVHFVPFVAGNKNDGYTFHTDLLRYDVTRPFEDAGSWSVADGSGASGLRSVGYNAGAFDGRFFYFAPWQAGIDAATGRRDVHGRVLRYDTLGSNGSFSLRYCDYGHNGGLCAAVTGPAFLVNTERGVVGAWAHRTLRPGWHHLAGSYDGRWVKLYVDGECVARRQANGAAMIHTDLPFTVGRIQGGAAAFAGTVHDWRVLPRAMTEVEVRAMAESRLASVRPKPAIELELDTYHVLDGRDELRGKVTVRQPIDHAVRVRATRLDDEQPHWQADILSQGEHAIEIPTAEAAGYFRLTAGGQGEAVETYFAVRHETAEPARSTSDALTFVADTVEQLIEKQSVRFAGRQDGATCLVVSSSSTLSYRSIARKDETGRYVTYWFPEQPFEYEAFRLDYESWPMLDELSRQSGDPRYRRLVDAMVQAFSPHGFDSASGLIYCSEESDFDVVRVRPAPRGVYETPKFKPINSGDNPQRWQQRLWERAPQCMHRCAKAMFLGLVTDPRSMDFNRFCFYGFDDAAGQHALTPNSSHCGFDAAGAGLIEAWSVCHIRTGDQSCLEWAQRMADKWLAVQDPHSGLVPDFFGAGPWQVGAAQSPGRWAELRGAALTASVWLNAARLLRQNGHAAGSLADQLADMGRRLALGVARYGYDAGRRVFREHLSLDGSPHQGAARYCFQNQQEKDEAVKADPLMAQVAVYNGAGFYRNPNYYEPFAGSNVPYHLAVAAALADEPALTACVGRLAADAFDESRQLTGPFTPEGRWTFRATGWYMQMHLMLHELTGRATFLDRARELARTEMARLAEVETPDWWRMPQRHVLLDALLKLAAADRAAGES